MAGAQAHMEVVGQQGPGLGQEERPRAAQPSHLSGGLGSAVPSFSQFLPLSLNQKGVFFCLSVFL